MIQVCNFSKAYKSSFKISGINFSVEPGKITALVGANGSGKSTIIKAICGFHYADGGQILVDGKTGYLPEVSNLPDKLYTADFLTYAARSYGLSGSQLDVAVRQAVTKCGLSDVLTKKIKTLSKGYKQRVSLAQALIHNPENLILDEPVSGLDPLQISQLHRLIKDFSSTKSILISTHILSEVESLCDNVVLIKNGRQLGFGSKADLKKLMEGEFGEI